MKKSILSISIILSLFSCSEDTINTTTETTPIDSVNQPKVTVEVQANTPVKDLSVFDSAVDDYIKCKKKSDKKYACKEYAAKVLCEAYGINDFKEGDNYIDYDKIPNKIKELNNWVKIGGVSKSNLKEAQKQLNDYGLPVIVFDVKHAYSPVSILRENGKTTVSGKWGGIHVPSALSFHSTKPNRSSAEKGLNLVYSSKENLEIWYRKSE